MFGKGLSLQNFILFVLDFLKFAVLLHLSLNHPNIQIFLLSTEPIAHSLLQFFKIIGQEVRALFSPSQSLRKIIASSQWNNGHWNSTVLNSIIGHLGDHPHDSSIATTDDEDRLCFFLTQEFSESFKTFLSRSGIFQVVKVDVYTNEVLLITGVL